MECHHVTMELVTEVPIDSALYEESTKSSAVILSTKQ